MGFNAAGFLARSMVESDSLSMEETTLSSSWLPMWLELDPFNLCQLKAQIQAGWQCQETGGLIGNLMLISMANLCPLRSQLPMDRLDSSQTLLLQIGGLARLSKAQYSSKLTSSSFRVQPLNWLRRACHFTRAARRKFFFFLMLAGTVLFWLWIALWRGRARRKTHELKPSCSWAVVLSNRMKKIKLDPEYLVIRDLQGR